MFDAQRRYIASLFPPPELVVGDRPLDATVWPWALWGVVCSTLCWGGIAWAVQTDGALGSYVGRGLALWSFVVAVVGVRWMDARYPQELARMVAPAAVTTFVGCVAAGVWMPGEGATVVQRVVAVGAGVVIGVPVSLVYGTVLWALLWDASKVGRAWLRPWS